jgi:NADPH-dependent 2,4-dienoyl-CoA reductase/sulfur reductase-like enzyme
VTFELVVIGAGPAGMAAAAAAAEAAVATILLDENAGPGGQIYRAIGSSPLKQKDLLGEDYWRGEELVRRFEQSGATYRPHCSVWALQATADGVEIGTLDQHGAQMIGARHAIVATGAMERPFPIPGWTLPGVMTVGGAQTLLKASALAPDGEAVIAGSGPLLYLYARQLIAAGAPPKLILDTTPKANWMRALRHAPGFLASRYLRRGLGLLAAVQRKVPVIRHVTGLRAEGDDRVREIVWQTSQGEARRQVDLLLLHQGVVPTINLWSAAACVSRWNDVQACWHAETDAWGQSSEPNIFIAGDGAGIGGAEIAAMGGLLAGLQVAHRSGRITAASRDQHAHTAQQALSGYRRGRNFLDALYRPADWTRQPTGETIVCRCEEISAAQIIDVTKQGCIGPNQMKAYIRCGMGPCQGRQCSLTVTELMAQEKTLNPSEIGHFRLRPPVKPLTLAELAGVPANEPEKASVIRF